MEKLVVKIEIEIIEEGENLRCFTKLNNISDNMLIHATEVMKRIYEDKKWKNSIKKNAGEYLKEGRKMR